MRAKSSWITLSLLLGTAILLFLLPSCDEIKEATTFKIKYDLPDNRYTLDQSTFLKTEMILFSQNYPAVNIDSIVGTHTGLVDKVTFYKLKFSIVTPETATINWLTSARITVNTDGGLPVEIATSPTINATDRSIDFLVTDTDILSTIKKPYIITLYGNLNRNIPVLPMEVLMQSGIEITVSPF